jgi:hypothetical protein
MTASTKRSLFDAIAISVGFLAVWIAVFAPQFIPVIVHNSSLLYAWRYFIAYFAIVFMRLVLGGSLPRVRVMA